METLTSIFTWITSNYKKIIVILIAILTAVAGVLHFIPGQPAEAEVEAVIDTLEKINPNPTPSQ